MIAAYPGSDAQDQPVPILPCHPVLRTACPLDSPLSVGPLSARTVDAATGKDHKLPPSRKRDTRRTNLRIRSTAGSRERRCAHGSPGK